MKKLVVISGLFLALISCKNDTKNEEIRKESETEIVDVVSVSGRQLMVNDKFYLIKGICYHPVPKGSAKREFGTLTQDLKLMVEAGINTIRVYAPIEDKHVLDEIENAGLKVIIGFGYNQDGKNDIL